MIEISSREFKGKQQDDIKKQIQTELQKIWTDVHILNHASYKTLEKVGFQREGHIRGGKMVNTYCDYYLYGILKSDYITRWCYG